MPRLHPALAFLVVLLTGIGLDRGFPPAFLEAVPRWLRIAAGAVLVKAAVGLVVWGVVALRRQRTPVEPGRTPRALVTDGPYRFTRNPLYLGQLLFLAGLGLAAFPWLLPGAGLQALLLNFLVIPGEERLIAAAFEADYGAYRARVRRWL